MTGRWVIGLHFILYYSVVHRNNNVFSIGILSIVHTVGKKLCSFYPVSPKTQFYKIITNRLFSFFFSFLLFVLYFQNPSLHGLHCGSFASSFALVRLQLLLAVFCLLLMTIHLEMLNQCHQLTVQALAL